MCGCKIFIQAGTYQELLNHWRKQQLIYKNNNANLLTRGSAEQFNAETILTRYSDVLLPDGESIHSRAKDASVSSMCDFPENIYQVAKLVMCVKLLQWISCCFCSRCRN